MAGTVVQRGFFQRSGAQTARITREAWGKCAQTSKQQPLHGGELMRRREPRARHTAQAGAN